MTASTVMPSYFNRACRQRARHEHWGYLQPQVPCCLEIYDKLQNRRALYRQGFRFRTPKDAVHEVGGSTVEGDAVALMQPIYRDPSQDMGLRLDAAKSAAKFEHPVLSAVALQPQPKTRIVLSMLSREERETMAKLLRRIMGVITKGGIDGRAES